MFSKSQKYRKTKQLYISIEFMRRTERGHRPVECWGMQTLGSAVTAPAQ